ncbi:type II toxin-antitoxin system RelE/ParE family toxin [Candidatus Saccharibacteria bacterium]|nr:type II toxin-antitoxin system RelE/ParE family toxin [Candidatus Saccharibacteria bacterium]
MKVYKIQFSSDAKKCITRLPKKAQDRIVAAAVALELNPRPHNVKKLVGQQLWRIRVGDYRIVYEIHDKEIFIMVVRVAHRKDAYR